MLGEALPPGFGDRIGIATAARSPSAVDFRIALDHRAEPGIHAALVDLGDQRRMQALPDLLVPIRPTAEDLGIELPADDVAPADVVQRLDAAGDPLLDHGLGLRREVLALPHHAAIQQAPEGPLHA